MNSYDLIVIGGGAAGIMAAISAKRAHPDYSVAILDRSFALGRKILVCGAGRCNITNINLENSAESHYYGASAGFISSILKQFSYKDITSFFKELGIELYVERKTNIGKVFPVTDQAKTVTTLLEDELVRLGVDVYLNAEVIDIRNQISENRLSTAQNFTIKINILNPDSNKITKSNDLMIYKSKYLILSAGGKTYPALGSNGSGFTLAEALGHTLIQPVPSALPLVSKNKLSQMLQGMKMEIEATSVIDGKKIKTTTDDVMFTQYGLSGPAILNISREISIQLNRLKKNNVQVQLNFFPGESKSDVADMLTARWNKRPDQTLEKSLIGLFPLKFPSAFLNIIGIDKNLLVGKLNAAQIELLCTKLTGFTVDIDATRGWNEAEFTAGGVDTNEVKPSTLESNLVPGLYLCGEILDVDGDVGGYNLSWAWASGFVAGKLG